MELIDDTEVRNKEAGFRAYQVSWLDNEDVSVVETVSTSPLSAVNRVAGWNRQIALSILSASSIEIVEIE